MPFLPLGVRQQPDAKSGFSASPSKRKADQARALHRDDYTCRYCGFRSEKYQRVATVDGEVHAVCLFCERCLALDATGQAGSGVLVWLPEMSQTDLHHLMRAIYVARAEKDHPLAEAANRALDALMARRAEAKRRLGSDDPLLLATIMLESLTPAEYAASAEKLDGLRLLPLDKQIVPSPSGDVDVFPRILAYWRSAEGPFAEFPVLSWGRLFTEAA